MSSVINSLRDVDFVTLVAFVPVLVLLSHVLAYILDPQGIRSVPGPLLAKFSDAWLGWTSGHGHRSEIVHELHKKYGAPVVQ